MTGFSSISEPVTGLVISASGSTSTLSWSNPSTNFFSHVVLRRSTSSFPSNVSSGTSVIANSISTSYSDASLSDGTYYYSMFAVDILGNASVAATSSVVIDTTAPTITLLGDATTSIVKGRTYTDAGASASDSIDGDVTEDITVTGSVDTATVGTYTLTYAVSDAHGNEATTVSRIITVEPSHGGGGVLFIPGTNGGGYSVNAGEGQNISLGDLTTKGVTFFGYTHDIGTFNIVPVGLTTKEMHSVTISDLDVSSDPVVTVTVASTPQTMSISQGEHKDIDINNDGKSDLKITFVRVSERKAELRLEALTSTMTDKSPPSSQQDVKSQNGPTAVCPSDLFVRDLTLGMNGSDVQALQVYLNTSGYLVATEGYGSPGSETTYFGPLTQAALSKFQNAKLVSSRVGFFDAFTRTYLGCSSPAQSFLFTRNIQFGMSGTDVQQLQTYLNAHNAVLAQEGYGSPGSETTYFGTLTKQALTRWQKEYGILSEVGYVGDMTRSMLNENK